MTEYVYVKPSPGGRIRMPDRNSIPMAPEGAWVPRIDFYERLLIGGDVVICDPPPEITAGVSDEVSPKPEGWDEVAEANSKALATDMKSRRSR
jgi:hypothetical protein